MEQRAIVVVGAGPAGSAAARAAALAGVAPLLVERDAVPGASNACGGVCALAYRDRLGLPAEVVEQEIVRTRLCVGGQTHEFARTRPSYISFERAAFDAFLARRAAEAGAELLTNTRVAAVDASQRKLVLQDRTTGAVREVVADMLLFADGPTTLAAEAFGIGHQPGPRTRRAIYWDLEGEAAEPDMAELLVDMGQMATGYTWVFPKRGHVQVGVGAPYGTGGPPLPQRLASFVESRDDLRGRRILRRHGGVIPGHVAERFVADGAMVVGDAAGLVNPMTGGGIAFALRSGEIAGRVAAQAVRKGRTDAAALRAYPRRWRRTSHAVWLALMARWRARLDRVEPTARAAAYARALRRYFRVFHTLGSVVDALVRRSHS